MPDDPHGSEALTAVQRWERAGGLWRVLARHRDDLTIALCRCDGGEEVQRLTSADADLRAYVGGRLTSED